MMPAIIVDPLSKTSTVNHTSRIRITQDQYIIEVGRESEHPIFSRFEVEADWDDTYHGDSEVVVEFMQRSGYKKIEMGTVSDINMVGSHELQDFQPKLPLHYRVLVLHHQSGILLGSSARTVLPIPVKASEKIFLLAFQPEKMDRTRTTRLDFPSTVEHPMMVYINSNCTELVEALQSENKNPAIFALTITPYLQTIAWRMISNIRSDSSLDLDPHQTWEGRWNTLITNVKGLGVEKGLEEIDYDDDDEAQTWVDAVVLAWSRKQGNPVRDVCTLLGGV